MPKCSFLAPFRPSAASKYVGTERVERGRLPGPVPISARNSGNNAEPDDDFDLAVARRTVVIY